MHGMISLKIHLLQLDV